MKKIIFGCLLLVGMDTTAQKHQLIKLWETDTIVAIPESVLPDLKNKKLYVSLIDGSPWEADGKGGVAQLGIDGKKYDGNWISGLNAPKGMGIYGNTLYVADISEVVLIDIKKGKVDKKIPLEGAAGLNDITIDGNGVVYISDSKKANIWRMENNTPAIFLENLKGVNGLKAVGEELYILSGKSFVKANAGKQVTNIAELPQGGDGIEPTGTGDFIISSWPGYIFYVSSAGSVELLLDTHEAKKNTADIGFDPSDMILYVPTFNGKQVVCYKVN